MQAIRLEHLITIDDVRELHRDPPTFELTEVEQKEQNALLLRKVRGSSTEELLSLLVETTRLDGVDLTVNVVRQVWLEYANESQNNLIYALIYQELDTRYESATAESYTYP